MRARGARRRPPMPAVPGPGLLQRRSRDERWPRRAALGCVVGLVVYAVYVAWFRSPTRPDGEDGTWTHRSGNTADTDVRGRKLGLPLPEGYSAEADDPPTQFDAASLAAKGAAAAARVADVACSGKHSDCLLWVDAGLAVFYSGRGKTSTGRTLLAVGVRSDYAADYLAAVSGQHDRSLTGPSSPCEVRASPDAVPPDAGWYVVCNQDLLVRALLYSGYNETHYSLPWPPTHRRCVGCGQGRLLLPASATRPVVPCTPWAHAFSGTEHSAARSYCINDTRTYLDQWMGHTRWLEDHMGHRFSHARLTGAVHEGLFLGVRTLLVCVAVVGGCLGSLVLFFWCSGVRRGPQ